MTMGKVIQQIYIGNGISLYVTNFDKETNILTYRISDIPEEVLEEPVQINEDFVCTSFCKFHITYLHNFIKCNEEIEDIKT